MKAALQQGAPLAVSAMPVNVTVSLNASNYADPVHVPADDGRLRLLGGPYLRGKTFPAYNFLHGQAITPNVVLQDSGYGIPNRYSLDMGIVFELPRNQSEFEVIVLNNGSPRLRILVDGRLTDPVGYVLRSGPVTGATVYAKVVLPPSKLSRHIKVSYNRQAIAGLNLPQGGSIDAARAARASVVFLGDSITEGTGSTSADRNFVQQASYRLGIDNPINVGLGGSGYIAARSGERNFNQRTRDVLEAVNGRAPDAVVVAGGINDCGNPAAELRQAALTLFQTLRKGAPNMPIFVVGPYTDYNNYDYPSWKKACRDTIFSAASEVSGTYTIDTSDWVTLANRDTVFAGTSNGPHPIDSGHRIYGQRLAAAMAAIINGM